MTLHYSALCKCSIITLVLLTPLYNIYSYTVWFPSASYINFQTGPPYKVTAKFSERILKNRTCLIPSLFNDYSGNLSNNNKTGAKFENLTDTQQHTLLPPTSVISFTCNVLGYM